MAYDVIQDLERGLDRARAARDHTLNEIAALREEIEKLNRWDSELQQQIVEMNMAIDILKAAR